MVMFALYFKIWRETIKRQKLIISLQAQNNKSTKSNKAADIGTPLADKYASCLKKLRSNSNETTNSGSYDDYNEKIASNQASKFTKYRGFINSNIDVIAVEDRFGHQKMENALKEFENPKDMMQHPITNTESILVTKYCEIDDTCKQSMEFAENEGKYFYICYTQRHKGKIRF